MFCHLLLAEQLSSPECSAMIIMVIMIFPRIRTRMQTMLEYGHHDYLSQHDLAQDQNKDEAYDGHPYYHGHHDLPQDQNQNEEYDRIWSS